MEPQKALIEIQAVTMADCQALVGMADSFSLTILCISFLFALAVGFFLGRSFITDTSSVFGVRVCRFHELIEADEVKIKTASKVE